MNSATEQNQQERSLGEIFRQTRESLNLSLEDVAKEIALRPSILQQLENNEFVQKSVPPTFIKGYVRSYAKFLRLPDSLWENIQFAEMERNDLGKNARATRSVNQYSSHSRWVGRLTALVLIVVLGMTGLWWWQNYQQSNAERDNLVQNYVATTENNAESASMNTAPAAVETQANTEKTVVEMPSPIAQSTENAAPESQPNEVKESAVENVAVLPQTTQDNVATEPQQAVADTQSAVENPTISPALPAVKGDLVVEVLNNTSWISVKDKNRKILAQKEYKKGEVLSFEGDTFSLIVGAPGNVRITYKGENYPLKVDGRVAKFRLSQP